MSAVTPTWGLAYPLGTDSFCTGYQPVAAMAATLDALLVTFTATLNRITTIPYASISASAVSVTPYVNLFGTTIQVLQYDTVNADTYSLTNLAAQPAVIAIPNTIAPGGEFFITAFFGQALSPVVGWIANDIIAASPVNSAFTTGETDFNSTTASVPGGGTYSLLQGAGSAGFEHYTQLVGYTNLTDIQVGYTSFAFWIGDA